MRDSTKVNEGEPHGPVLFPDGLFAGQPDCALRGASRGSLHRGRPKTKRTHNGDNYLDIYPLGLVPLLRFDDGSLLIENAAILQYIAARYPGAGLAPRDEIERARLQQWLCFIGTELHKALFIPLFAKERPEGTRSRILEKSASRLAYLDSYRRHRDLLLDRFSVADAYLYTVLNWTVPTRVDLTSRPAIQDYRERLHTRPRISRAVRE